MKAGEESKTAEFVCLARAVAHVQSREAKFSDPTAAALLSEDAQASFQRLRAGVTEVHEQWMHHLVRMRSEVIATRTIAIDEAIRGAEAPQLVNLGAGLDGRAWRMAELSKTVVFEVDHPASQARKQVRVAALTQLAKEVRFVPVDFARDPLAAALARAHHDSDSPTIWVWEGVVPYLTPAEVEATLAVVAQRSAPGSRLAVAYQMPSAAPPGQPGVRAAHNLWASEPLRSWWTPEQMRVLLARAGFHPLFDRDLVDLAAEFKADLSGAGLLVREGRVVVADLGRPI